MTDESTIELEVLRVASRDELGTSKKLTVASPCLFSNARGNLRGVRSSDDIRDIAGRSAEGFVAGLVAAGVV